MKKFVTVLLALTLVLSMVLVFSACGKKETPTTEPAVVTQDEPASQEAETVDETLPKAGDTVTLGKVSVTIPTDWEVEKYSEGVSIEIAPADAFMKSVEISVNPVYGSDRAKEWADNTNGNYGGDKEIDSVKIAGADFYRVKADAEQNICFTDLDDSSYLKVSVMFMPWEDASAVLDAITIK